MCVLGPVRLEHERLIDDAYWEGSFLGLPLQVHQVSHMHSEPAEVLLSQRDPDEIKKLQHKVSLEQSGNKSHRRAWGAPQQRGPTYAGDSGDDPHPSSAAGDWQTDPVEIACGAYRLAAEASKLALLANTASRSANRWSLWAVLVALVAVLLSVLFA